MTTWTPQQLAAIEAEGGPLLVAAGAGSGKTAVLVERVASRVLRRNDPVGVDEILVVTFTEAAAAQMRRRIGKALEDALLSRPGDPHLSRQLALLPRAPISTLHAFCMRVLRRFFHHTDLDPGFVVLGEHETLLLAEDVLDDVMERRYSDGSGEFHDLVDRYGGDRGDLELRKAVRALHGQSRSLPFPERWLEGAAALDEPDRMRRWLDLARRVGLVEARSAARLLGRAERASRQPGGPGWLADLLGREREAALRVAEALESAAGAEAVLAGVAFSRAPTGSKAEREAADGAALERVKAWRDEARKILEDLRDGPLGDPRRAARAEADHAALAGPLRELAALVRDFDAAFREAKRRRQAVDFGDLEQLCLALLRDPARSELEPSDVALVLRGRFREILVDEYQDVNPVQEAILGLIARPREDVAGSNLFLVGDVKQSIYRFRMADPHLFLRRAEAYPADGPGPRRIDLQTNFRSHPRILDAINHVFRAIMTPEAAELAYDARAESAAARPRDPLSAFGPHPNAGLGDPPVEVHFLDPRADGDPGTTKLEREAAAVAARIAELLRSGMAVEEDGSRRPLRASDVGILLRAANAHGPVFGEALAALGIPFHAQAGTGYFGTIEVETMLALLGVIDNPRQDIPLAAVLRSPIVGIPPADLARIRLARPEGDFYDALVAHSGQDARCGDFLARLDAWRTAARRRPLSALVWDLLTSTGYLAFSGALPGGAQRRANLLALHDRAREFDHFTRQGLFRFLRFMRRLEAAGEDLGQAPPAGESADVVRVMSVHRSKGLEFPVVVVAALGQRFNARDAGGDLLIDRELGLGAKVADPDLRVKYPSLAHRVVAAQVRRQGLAEEMRVLYVAMTRARERLLLFGTPRVGLETWAEAVAGHDPPLPPDLVASAAAPADWIAMALALGPAGPSDLFTIGSGALGPAGPRDLADNRSGVAPDRIVPTPDEVDRVIAHLAWSYPHAALARCPAKVAASHAEPPGEDEAPHPEAVRPRLLERPRFVQAGAARLTAAERGTATHLLMRHLDFEADATETGLEARLAALVDLEILAPEAARGIDTAAILNFLNSSTGRHLAAAQREGKLHREVAFSVKAPAGEIQPDLPPELAAGEWVLVQGVIDAVLEEPDGLTVLDYKTDYSAGRTPESMAQAHRGQLRRYREAAAEIFDCPVKRLCLVFLALGEVVDT